MISQAEEYSLQWTPEHHLLWGILVHARDEALDRHHKAVQRRALAFFFDPRDPSLETLCEMIPWTRRGESLCPDGVRRALQAQMVERFGQEVAEALVLRGTFPGLEAGDVAVNPQGRRFCPECQTEIIEEHTTRRVYCSNGCRDRAWRARKGG